MRNAPGWVRLVVYMHGNGDILYWSHQPSPSRFINQSAGWGVGVRVGLGGDGDADLEAELGDACGLVDDGEDDALGGEAQ